MSKETVKQYIRNQYTGKQQCQFLPQINQKDPLTQPSLDAFHSDLTKYHVKLFSQQHCCFHRWVFNVYKM